MGLIPGIGIIGFSGIKLPTIQAGITFVQLQEGFVLGYSVGNSNASGYIGYALAQSANPTYGSCLRQTREPVTFTLGQYITKTINSTPALAVGTYHVRVFYEIDGERTYSTDYEVLVKTWPVPQINFTRNGNEVYVTYSIYDSALILTEPFIFRLSDSTTDGSSIIGNVVHSRINCLRNINYTYTYTIPDGRTLNYLKGTFYYSVNGYDYQAYFYYYGP